MEMKFALLCKRQYTNKDLIADRFGRLFHLPDQLNNLGHDGVVIAGDIHKLRAETIQINGVEYHSLPLSVFRLPQFIKKVYELLKRFKPDVLIASGDSYWGYLGLKMAQKLDIPFVFDVYDDYTVFGTNKIPGMKSLFNNAVQKADLVITASGPLKEKLASVNDNILIIENGYDPELFRPLPKADCRRQIGIRDEETVIGYFGSIEKDLGMEVLLKAAEILREDIDGLRLLLAGSNEMKLDFDSLDADYRGFLPQQDIPVHINGCDVVVIPYLPSKQVQQSNACKIAEYIACRIPVVVTNVSNHADIFAEAARGICEPGSPESMAQAIRTQLEYHQLVDIPVELTWENQAKKLSAMLEKIKI